MERKCLFCIYKQLELSEDSIKVTCPYSGDHWSICYVSEVKAYSDLLAMERQVNKNEAPTLRYEVLGARENEQADG